MKSNLDVTYLSDTSIHSELVRLSFICPHCGRSLSPKILSAFMIDDTDEYDNKLFVTNFCPACDNCFLSCHTYNEDSECYEFVSNFPSSKTIVLFSENICSISPDFVSIYSDASSAETNGLSTICGIGYRKSLEFLVKDYAIYLCPESETDIIKKSLSSCIRDHIENEHLKKLALAAAWLGNDETHYVRKHEDYNIAHLKSFINAFVTFIDAELAVSEASKLLQS